MPLASKVDLGVVCWCLLTLGDLLLLLSTDQTEGRRQADIQVPWDDGSAVPREFEDQSTNNKPCAWTGGHFGSIECTRVA
ncbi:MAG: hypothetical protein M2R45_01653 [Verrucomicrobia subdivision 3 bacterium]|nr:hypothetical protein [Limisphaerales bacterium]MCS1412804.1 hypothetical protein [Limisphaerales bacterium]